MIETLTPLPTGVLSVLAMPFTADGGLDLTSLEALVEHNVAWGVDAVVCFGLAGELYKLTDPERAEVLDVVVRAASGRVPVIAGTEHTSVEGAVQRSRWAQDAGAAAVMVYPPSFVRPGADGIVEYFEALSEAVTVPIIVQDAPSWTGVDLPMDLLETVADHAPRVTHVKVEAPPTAPKLAMVGATRLHGIGGFGALHLGEELSSGIVATMPGCAMPGLFVDLWRAHTAGHSDEAWSLYTAALPMLTFQMGGLDVFVSTQKLLLRRLGVIASDRLRRPGKPLSADQIRWLDDVLDRQGLRRYLETGPVSPAQ